VHQCTTGEACSPSPGSERTEMSGRRTNWQPIIPNPDEHSAICPTGPSVVSAPRSCGRCPRNRPQVDPGLPTTNHPGSVLQVTVARKCNLIPRAVEGVTKNVHARYLFTTTRHADRREASPGQAECQPSGVPGLPTRPQASGSRAPGLGPIHYLIPNPGDLLRMV